MHAAAAQDLSLSTVVIDAGHGGNDPGAVSRDGKDYEKTFTLDIAQRLSDKIKAAYPEVKVILTRSKDVTVALNDRAAIANKAGADLFISIHINAAPSTTPNGFSVHVLGQSSKKDRDLFAYNLNVCKRENSVILLEDDYTTKYQGFDPNDPESFIFMQLMQNANLEQSLAFAECISKALNGGPVKADRGIWQDPFLVLWKTSMPAVLVELGFISNSADLKVLKSETDRNKLAARLFNAFRKYKEGYDDSMTLDVEVEGSGKQQPDSGKASDAVDAQGGGKPDQSGKTASAPSADGECYGIQIFAGSNLLGSKDKAFMGYEPRIVKVGSVYKYIIGVEDKLDDSRAHLADVRKKYPQAFLVKISGDTVSAVKQ